TVNHSRADADESEVADVDATTGRNPGSQLSAISDPAIMIDRSAGIDDYVVADLGAGLDYGPSENDGAGADPHVGADRRGRVHDGAQLKTCVQCDCRQLRSVGFIADRDHDPADTLSAQPPELLATVQNRQTRAMKSCSPLASIIDKRNRIIQSLSPHRV